MPRRARNYASGSVTIPPSGKSSDAEYFAELDGRPDALEPLREAARKGTVTLLYSSHDAEHNNAVALKEYLEHKRR